MKFKDTEYGDLTNQLIKNSINVKSKFLTSLEGCPETLHGLFNCENNELTSLKGRPKKILGSFNCSNNKLTSLDGRPKYMSGTFKCKNNKDLKNQTEQIIKNQIVAFSYDTDEGNFTFKSIEKEFVKEKINKEKKILLETKQKIKSQINHKDFGLSI